MRVSQPAFRVVPPQAAKRPAARAIAQAPAKVASGWDRKSYLPPAGAPVLDKAEAARVAAFFDRYPSRGATQITFFHSYWALHQTFQQVPLQAYLYSATRPVDDRGRPRNAQWAAYAQAVATGKPPAEVERAFLEAHIQAFKDVVRTPEFKALYATSTPKYRQVVEAYLDALTQFEKDLARGVAPEQVSRGVFTDTMAWLQRRKVRDGGFMATGRGMLAMLNPFNPLARGMWKAFGRIAMSTLFDQGADRPAPTAVTVTLSADEAKRLSALTRIPFKAGSQALTEEMLAQASVAEPERREKPKGPAKRYPLTMADFTAPQKLRKGQYMAGADGVMSAREIEGVVANVQGRVRSQLIEDFFAKYPVPQAGIQVYSANMLSMNGVYGQSEMANTLADGIMPVDNDGKPKNAEWRAYAEAYDRHKATGAPSMEMLETLWFKAHMKDFEIVDTPAFKRQLDAFWADADRDSAFEPLAIYTKAMVGGRQEYEKASQGAVSAESAFTAGLGHFAKTILGSKTFPFWQHDLREARAWLADRNAPTLDERGLPTDHALFARAVSGLKQMTGLRRVGLEGLKQNLFDRADRLPAQQMVDLSQVLTPEQLAQVDPRVVAFYKSPNAFDITSGLHLPEHGFGGLLLGKAGPAVSGLGDIPDRQAGFEGYPIESELYKDAAGGTHWDRFVVVDGVRRDLFRAKFEVEGKQLKETFNVNGVELALYFDAEPHQGGLRLTLDHEKSSKLAALSNIVFTTVPTEEGLKTMGVYTCKQMAKLVEGTVEMRMTPKSQVSSRSLT